MGSLVSGVLGGGKGGGSKSTSSSEQSTRAYLPDYMQGPIEDLTSALSGMISREYTPYTGQRFADFNEDQLAAFEGTRNLQDAYKQYYDTALGLSQEGSSITPEDVQGWMNPYQQAVIDINKRETLRDFDQQMNTMQDQEMQIGSFGGSRTAIAEAEARRNVQQRLSDIQTQGMATAYDSAIGTALANANLQQGSATNLANLASAAQSGGYRDLAALQAIGGQQQALDQSQLDFDYGQFTDAQNWDYNNLGFLTSNLGSLAGIVRGEDSTGTTTTTTEQIAPKMGGFQKAMGIASLVAAPFTGGASLAGGMGGLSSLGSLAGSLGNAGFALNSIAGSGGAYSNPLNTVGRAAMGAYGPGFKEGGKVEGVQTYQNGGYVTPNNTFLRSAEDWSRALDDLEFRPTKDTSVGGRMLGGAQNILLDILSAPTDAAVGLYGGTGEAVESLKDFLAKTPEDIQKEREEASEKKAFSERENELMRALDAEQAQRDSQEAFMSLPEAVRNVLTTPQDTGMADREADLMRAIGADEATPLSKVKDAIVRSQEKQGIANTLQQPMKLPTEEKPMFNNALLRMGAAILQGDPMKPGLAHLGAGVDAYLDEKASENKIKAESGQQAMENALARIKAGEYSRQNDIQEARLEFEASQLPLKQRKMKADIKKIEMEAASNPYIDKAYKNVSSRMAGTPMNMLPEGFDLMSEVRKEALQLQQMAAQGISEGSSIGSATGVEDPLGLLSN